MKEYIAAFKQYVDFKTRTSRKGFWMFVLFNFIFMIVASILDGVIAAAADTNITIISGLYSLAILIPSLAIAVRRLHDTGKSGWWLLIGLVPFVGAIILFIFYVMPSQAGKNQWGDVPSKAEMVQKPA